MQRRSLKLYGATCRLALEQPVLLWPDSFKLWRYVYNLCVVTPQSGGYITQIMFQLYIIIYNWDRLRHCCKFRRDQNWQRGTSFGCQNWSGRIDFGSKSGPEGPILAKVSGKIGRPDRFYGGLILVWHTYSRVAKPLFLQSVIACSVGSQALILLQAPVENRYMATRDYVSPYFFTCVIILLLFMEIFHSLWQMKAEWSSCKMAAV